MRLRHCPACGKAYWDWEATLTGRRPATPFFTCRRCHAQSPDPYFKEIALVPYRAPQKFQVLLCGLWPFGILGFAAILLGMALNELWVVIAGGLAFSFWILLIALSLCLWQEVCKNAHKAYDESLARLHKNSKTPPCAP